MFCEGKGREGGELKSLVQLIQEETSMLKVCFLSNFFSFFVFFLFCELRLLIKIQTFSRQKMAVLEFGRIKMHDQNQVWPYSQIAEFSDGEIWTWVIAWVWVFFTNCCKFFMLKVGRHMRNSICNLGFYFFWFFLMQLAHKNSNMSLKFYNKKGQTWVRPFFPIVDLGDGEKRTQATSQVWVFLAHRY